MLCRVETEAVNAAVDQILEEADDSILHIGVAGVEVRAAGNMTLNDLLGVAVAVRIDVVLSEIGR